MVNGFGVISIILISIGLDGIAMVFDGSQPLSVNDPLDRFPRMKSGMAMDFGETSIGLNGMA